MTPTRRTGADGSIRREPPEETSFVEELRPDMKRRQWVIQRLVWGVMAAIIVLALLGFCGSGPLSRTDARATVADGEVTASYSRFARQKAPQQMDLRVTTTSPSAGEFHLIVPPETQSVIRVDSVTPDAESVVLAPEGAVYSWPVSGTGEFLVTVRFEALRWRRLEMDVGVQIGEAMASRLTIRQWVYP